MDVASNTHGPVPSEAFMRYQRWKATRGRKPSARYICRLCNVPGHWIDECHLFVVQRHRRPEEFLRGDCALCHGFGHRLEHCLTFRPLTHQPFHPLSSLSSPSSPSIPSASPSSLYPVYSVSDDAFADPTALIAAIGEEFW